MPRPSNPRVKKISIETSISLRQENLTPRLTQIPSLLSSQRAALLAAQRPAQLAVQQPAKLAARLVARLAARLAARPAARLAPRLKAASQVARKMPARGTVAAAEVSSLEGSLEAESLQA